MSLNSVECCRTFRRITASIVHGSGIGPTAFVLTASDLRDLSLLIFLNKYADDCYLIVPPDQASLISSELEHIDKWAQDNNLKLNALKIKGNDCEASQDKVE